MRKAIAYSYLDSEKEHLRSLTPWLPRVDYVICEDGRYKTPLTPKMRRKNLPNYSIDNSYEVLEKLCGDKFVYDKLFDTQIEKRNRCFEIAGELDCDIVIVWDSDDLIHPDYQDWDKFFKQIETMVEHFPDQTYKMWAWIPKVEDWCPQYNAVPPETWIKYDRVHRDPKNLKYVNTHYTWTTKDVTTEQINEWKWSHPNSSDTDNPFYRQGNTILDGVRFTTNRALRTRNQLEFGDGWTYQNMHWEAYEYDIKPYWHHKGFELMYEGLKKDRYPNLEYYFNSDDKAQLIPYYINEKGEYVRIISTQLDDGTYNHTEEVLLTK